MNPYSNANLAFIPSAAPDGTSDLEHFTNGIYAYVNAESEPEFQKRVENTFGRTVPFTNSQEDATIIGRAFASHTGYRQDPISYLRENNIPVPSGWNGENAQLYSHIGKHVISHFQEHYKKAKAERDAKIAEIEKDMQETNNNLPSMLAKSIRSAGGKPGEDLTPEYLQKLTKYGVAKGAVEAQHRAALAWQYMSAYMDAPEIDDKPLRERLLNVADALSDDEGKLDNLALATFSLLAREKALELQEKTPDTVNHMLSVLEHKLKSSLENDSDNEARTDGMARFNALAKAAAQNNQSLQQVLESGNHIYGDKVETLLSVYREAIDLSKDTPEQAHFITKAIADAAGFAGEQVIPLAGSIAGAVLMRGAGGGRVVQQIGSWAGGAYASYDSIMSRNYADAVRTGKINPEMYAAYQSLAEAGAEGLFNIYGETAASRAAGRWIASRAAGARWLSNTASQAFIRNFGFIAMEGAGELAEEELSGMAGSTINALARRFGVEVTPQAYKLGEAVGSMELHEIAGIFIYTALLHGVNVSDNFAKARAFAQNTDNLLKAGHTAAEAREVQLKTFEAEDKIQDIWLNKDLSEQQKRKESDKISREFFDWQKNYHEKQVMTLSNKELRARLAKQGVETRSEAEVKLDIENETDLQILKEHNVLQAIIVPGEKYQMSFYEKGEKQEDGNRAPGKIITQEWTREQLTNWLTFQKDTRYAREANELNAKIMANQLAHADNAQQLAIEYKSLGDNADYKVLKEIRTNGITPHFFKLAAQDALKKIMQNQAQGMSLQQALQQPSELVEGYSLGAVLQLGTAAAERQQQAANTTEGKLKGITKTSSVEFGAMNKVNRDGSAIVSYAKNRATILDFIEEIFEIQIKRLINGNNAKAKQLAAVIAHIESKLPGNIKLLQNKDNTSTSDFIEAFSKLATSAYLYQQQRLPLNPAGHQLVQTVARSVDSARTFKVIGDAWNIFANSKEGKQYLQETGKGLADFLTQAGFTLDTAFDNFKADAQKRAEVIEARNWQPAIEDELDALLEEAEEESELNEINEQEAKDPITIPADQSITGQEITIEPQQEETIVNSQSSIVNPPAPAADLTGTKATTILSHMRDLIAKGKARAEHFAIVFREIPGLTEAQAIEQGIRPLTQRGEPTAAYTQGKLLAERCTDVQYLLLREGKLTQKAKRDILGAPRQTRRNPAWPKRAKKGTAPADQRITIIKALQNAVDYAAENPNYNLNFTRHIISKGREYYIATDGRRLAVIERTAPKGSKNIEESLDKNGNVVKDAKFPESWRQVIITLTDKAQTLDLAPFRYLETYPKTAINHVVWQDSEGKLSKYNPNYIGKGIKFFSTLSKAIGSPSIIQVDNQNMGPILMQSDHDGWTAKYLLMPMRLVDGDIYKEGDILLTPQTESPANFSIKAVNTEAQKALTFESTPDTKAEKVKQDLERLKNTELHCINAPDIVATVKARQRGKLVSPAALNKSIANGFTMSQHLAAANKIDELYKFAIPLGEYDDMNHEANVKAIFRFACPVRVDSKIAFALLTLKRTEGDKLYSLELDEINQLGGTLDRLKHLLKEEPSTIPLRAADDVVARFLSKVKEYFGENALPPVSATESADLFTDGVLEAENAIVTQPDVDFSIKALHASPHLFYKFSTDFMGSGEGVQAFGWGLYFAESIIVNKGYFKAFKKVIENPKYKELIESMETSGLLLPFANKRQAKKQIELLLQQAKTKLEETKKWLDIYSKPLEHTGEPYRSAIREALSKRPKGKWARFFFNDSSIRYAIRKYKESTKSGESKKIYNEHRKLRQQNIVTTEQTIEQIKKNIDTLESFMAALQSTEQYIETGYNYRVELNVDDSNLVMWEKPISRELHILAHKEVLLGNYEEVKDQVATEPRLHGYRLYRELSGVLGSQKAASEWLLAHGYKGIKYLDGNSRSAGEGTYNYVIFSGDDIKITAVNKTGTWSMDEGWEEYTDPTANFSIRAATPSTLDRFTADPLGERIVHTVRTEARRYARVLGDKTPQEQAMNAIASAESIINAVDKYLHRPDKPVSRRHRDQLTKLRSIIEKYAQIIASGTPRSFKKISPAEQQELETAIADLEAAELDTAETDPALLIEDDNRMNKRTREARSREHHRAIVREAAKGRVYKVLAAMLDTTADALDDYLKDQLLTKLHRLTATVAIKRTPSKRLKGKMTAPMYRELEQAIQLMAYSTRQKEDAIDTILSAHETLAQAIASNEDNLTHGNTLLIELAHQLEQEGTPVTAKNLTAALAAHEARVAIFADINSKDYEQTRTAANAIYHIIRYGRAIWQQKHEAREAEIQVYLRHFLANTTAEQGKANAINEMLDKFKWRDALSLNATMNAAQTLLALSSYEPLRPIMQKVLENYATASVARQKHLQEMRKQELYIFGRILGIKPATQAGYSDKQLREISDKFDTFYTENNKTHDTGITVTWQERNEDGVLETYTSKPLQLTKWEALNLILTYRQQDYQTNAQIHGYTDEVLTKLENFIGTDLMDFGNGIQNALINDGTIAVYEEREGIPMRSNPLYWPGNINLNTLNTTREEPLTNPYHPAAGHDFLHTRVRHRNEIAHMNAFNVWRKAVADRANYVYSDPITTQLESLLARQQFAGRLKTLIGEGLFRQLKATITEIKNAAWQETTLQDVNNTIIATAFASKSLAVLSGNPGSLVRQLSAVANAGLMPGLTPAKFMQYAIGLKQGQGHIGITDILKLDSFTTRERDNAYVNEMIAMGNNAKFSHLMDWAKAGMNAMDKLDLLANAFSAAIVYNHKYDQLKALGTLTEEQIKQQCENAVAVYTKLLAQPLNRTDKSALYWQLGNHALGRAVLFMSSESINKIGMLRANYIRLRNEGKNPAVALGAILGTMGITVGLTAAITEAALALLTGSLPDDDDNIAAWATAIWLNASYGQYLGSLPLIGGASDIIFSPYGGYTSGDFRIPGIDTFRYGSKLVQMLTDNKTYTAAQWDKETTRFMRDFTAVLGFAGGAYSRWQWYSHFAAFSHSLTAALNALYPIARGAEAYSDPIPNGKRKPRRSKSKIEQWLTPESK